MSCDALRLKLLAARDARQQALVRALQAGWPATLALALAEAEPFAELAGRDPVGPIAEVVRDAV